MIVVLLALILLSILFPGLMRLAFGILALMIFVFVIKVSDAPAAELDFPIYNPNVFCKIVGENNPQYPNGSAEKICLANEQDAYDIAKYIWPSATSETKTRCSEMANKWPAREHVPYEVLSSCLSAYAGQDRLARQGAFKY